MKIPFTGGCVCGAIRYECSAEPIMTFKCHCRDCQHVTGGGFVPGLLVPASAFGLTKGNCGTTSRQVLPGENINVVSAPSAARGLPAENPKTHQRNSLASPPAASTIQAGSVRKWISSFRTRSRGTKWIRPFRNTNSIHQRHRARKTLENLMPKIKTIRGIENRKVISQKEWLAARKKLLA